MSKPAQTSHSEIFFVAFALVVMAALALVSLGGRTAASHNCVDAGIGTGSSNNKCGADSFTIDMQDAGNTASGLPAGHTEVLGTVEACIQINENGVLDADEDAIDAVFFDVTVVNIPAGPPHNPTGVIGLSYVIDYDSSNLTIAAEDSNFFLRANASSSLLDLSDAVPDDNFDNLWTTNLLDTNSGDPEEGSGVLQRITLESEGAVATGSYRVTIVAAGSHLTIDPDNDVQNPDVVTNGRVVVNAGTDAFTCSTLTPPPTTPTPTPTPTPPPPTISPTPTATPTPTPTLTPTPPFTLTPTPTPTSPPSTPTRTRTPTPTPTVAPGFHDASVKRLGTPASVHLLPGAADTTGSLTTVVVMNESNHTDRVAVYLAYVPPLISSARSNCFPMGVVNLGVVTLLPGGKITLRADPEWACEDPTEVDGLPWTLKAFADIHADDGASCATLTQVFNGQCSAALANDDHDDTDNAKTRARPRIVALTP